MWTAVLHREHGGGVHAHILAAQCDLQTGRSLNIAPPGWEKTFAPLRDAFNYEHGWSRPDDPRRARAQRPGHVAYIEASRLRAGLEHEADPRTLIRDYLVQRVEHGLVKDRADVVSALEDVGLDVTRQGRDYITARDPDSGKRWRLRGELYERDFEPERLDLPAEEQAEGRPEADRGRSRARARAARRELERNRKRRAAFHRGRYGRGDRADARVADEGLDELDTRTEWARAMLAEIEETTWGVELMESSGDRYVSLPAGTTVRPAFTLDGRPYLKLSRE